MTRHPKHDSITEDSINLLLKNGLAEGLPRIAELLLNAAMIVERSAHIGARPFERSDTRIGYANGLKERTLHSSLGALIKDEHSLKIAISYSYCISNI